MENISNSDNNTILLYSQWIKYLKTGAVISFILGFIALLYFPIDYSKVSSKEFSIHFDHKNGLQDLASVLLGTTGLMWSLTATFLFIYTIFQTRAQIAIQQKEIENQVKEMKTSNETFEKQYQLAVSQQYRNTFFSLLENHTKLLDTIYYSGKQGILAINIMQDHIRNSRQKYETCVYIKSFESFKQTEEFMPYKYFVASNSINSLLKNLCTTVKYIDEFLKADKSLYYEILDNNLSVAEKFLIDSYCTYYATEQTKFLIEHEYSFKDFDETKTFVLNVDSYFPTLKIEFNETFIHYHNFKNSNITFFNCVIQNVYDELRQPLHLIKIVLSVSTANGNVVHSAEQPMSSKIDPQTEYLCDAANNLAKGYLKGLTNINEDITFSYSFIFDYAGTHYLIVESFKFKAYGNQYNFSFARM